jgi:hypothetical protein
LIELTYLSFHKCKNLLDGLETSQFKKEKPTGKLVIPKGVGELMPAHIKYLIQRGFNYKEIRHIWKIQGIGIASHLAWRIFIPIIHHEETVSWTTRSISKSKKVTRYISAPLEEESIPHKSLLYGEDFAHHSIIITEGPLDVWKIGPGAAATKIAQYPTRVICFDNTKQAQLRAYQLCNDLSVLPGKTYNILLDAKDAGSATEKEIEKLRKKFLK